ncbi:ChaC-domain-containing protein [Athelia psychrophila]|uniref:glutathione-specific gamma-glutamylcyclotransferase n=1 Tax=Athelia psychrophila TaxID=1759441 RepID=A0A167W0M5_9AGAM|nr:ChaC-domain-containing protein [Fibularhizoctonia sp. CBS 109695]
MADPARCAAPGYLKGYVRRFTQHSEDHRGTPESPGRVVTLIRKQDWDVLDGPAPYRRPLSHGNPGMAYTIDSERVEEVKAYLDYREKGGYNEETVNIYGIVNGEERVIIPAMQIFALTRPETLQGSTMGLEPLKVYAKIISRSTGPSGKNKDYLYHIAEEAVHELVPESRDWYLDELEVHQRNPSQKNLHNDGLLVGESAKAGAGRIHRKQWRGEQQQR